MARRSQQTKKSNSIDNFYSFLPTSAYCTRCDIKPLSTADFGKVMKQVFPGIRPRRLGTRGNSRYCYAAMRKATKLDAPKLPELATKKYAEISNAVVTSDECAWKTIKNWAETLLGGAFDTMSELADHITDNNLCSLANNTSRQLLKKKIMQREAKDKRLTGKNGNVSVIASWSIFAKGTLYTKPAKGPKISTKLFSQILLII
jgi:RFX DNA-binding domain